MSLLIIGVLFLVAALAIGGVVFLVITEPHTQEGSSTQVSTSTRTIEPIPHETVEIAAEEQMNQPLSLQRGQEQSLSSLKEQYRAAAGELVALRGQVQELQHRLQVLTDRMERIERSRNVRSGHIEEEMKVPFLVGSR